MRYFTLWLFLIPALAWCEEKPAAVPQQTRLSISFDTTRILGPLDKYGFVDYLAAANESYSEGVTPENNYEVVVQRVVAPDDVAGTDRKLFFKTLGIEKPNPPFFIGLVDWTTRERNWVAAADDGDVEEFFNDLEFAENNPWTQDQHLSIAKWLTEQNNALDRIVRGSRLPRNFTPHLPIDDPDNGIAFPHLVVIATPSAHAQRKVASALRIRANLRLARHDLQAAWDDTIAISRIVRLTSQGVSIVQPLVAVVVDHYAFDSAVQVLQSPDLSDQLVDRMVQEMKRLQKFSPVAEKIDRGERFGALSTLQWCANSEDLNIAVQRISEFAGVLQRKSYSVGTLVLCRPDDYVTDQPRPKKLLASDVNWNRSAKLVNRWYDRLSEIFREFDFETRTKLLDTFEDDLNSLYERVQELQQQFADPIPVKSRDERGDAFGEFLVAVFMPPLPHTASIEMEVTQRRDVLQLSLATEAFKRKRGQYPLKLKELVGEHTVAITKDRFSSKPIQYRRTNDGFVLYSAGRNGKDDLGRCYKDRGTRETVDWDDIVVRVKR